MSKKTIRESGLITIVQMYRSGSDVRQVAELYNTTIQTIYNHIKKLRTLGVDIPKHRAKKKKTIDHEKVAELLKSMK